MSIFALFLASYHYLVPVWVFQMVGNIHHFQGKSCNATRMLSARFWKPADSHVFVTNCFDLIHAL